MAIIITMADFDDVLLMKTFTDEFDVLKYIWLTQQKHTLKEIQGSNLIQKSDKRATELKDLANVEFSKRNFIQAKILYFQAMRTASYNSIVYGIVFANMSACFFEMKMWTITVALVDIALNSACPKALHPKLYIRKIEALIKMSNKINAAKTASELQNFIETCDFSQAKKDELLKLSSEALNGTGVNNYFDSELVLPDLEVNPKFPNVSRKVQFCTNEKYGHHLIAKEVINQGECILIEKPYCSVGLYRCACCNNIINESILPCKICTITIYCSESCLVTDEIIHKWECKLFQNETLYEIDLKVQLAYRIFLKRIEAGFMVDAKEKIDLDANALNFSKLHKPIFKDTRMIFQLANQCCKIMVQLSQDDHFMAWIKNKMKDIDFEILMIGRELLHFAIICNCNSVVTPDTESNLAVYVSRNFFNHSCVPNTVESTVNSYLVLKAIDAIKPGEQIYISYIGQEKMSHSVRQELLFSKWNFICECKLCSTGLKNVGNYICPNCTSCDTRIHFNLLMCNSCQEASVIPLEKLLLLSNVSFNERVLADVDDNVLYGLLNLGNGIEMNPNSYCGQVSCFNIVTRKLKSEFSAGKAPQVVLNKLDKSNKLRNIQKIKNGDLENIETYLPYIRNIRSYIDVDLQKHNKQIYKNLLIYTKSIYFSPNRFSSQLELSTLNGLIDHLSFLQVFWNLYSPYKIVLKNIGDMKKFFTFQKQLLQFQRTIEWTE